MSDNSPKLINTSIWNYPDFRNLQASHQFLFIKCIAFCDMEQHININQFSLPKESTTKDLDILAKNGFLTEVDFETYQVDRLGEYWKFRTYTNRGYHKFASEVFRRDNFTCQYCGHKSVNMTLDHIIPQTRDGEDKPKNLVTSCQECNSKKGNQTPSEAGMSLANDPRENHGGEDKKCN